MFFFLLLFTSKQNITNLFIHKVTSCRYVIIPYSHLFVCLFAVYSRRRHPSMHQVAYSIQKRGGRRRVIYATATLLSRRR